MIMEACRLHLPAGFRRFCCRLVDEDLWAARNARVFHRSERGSEVGRIRAEGASARLGELLLRKRDLVARVRRMPADARRLVAAREGASIEGYGDRDEHRLGLALSAHLHRVTCGIADRNLV